MFLLLFSHRQLSSERLNLEVLTFTPFGTHPERPAAFASVVVLSFNHERYILHTLNSVLTDSDYVGELIVIDDASSDRSQDFVKSWVSEKSPPFAVRLVCKPTNKGVVNSLNLALSLSKWSRIRFCSSDDLIVPGSILRMNSLLEFDSRKSIVVGDVSVIDARGEFLSQSLLFDYFKRPKRRYLNCRDMLAEVVNHWRMAGPYLFVDKRRLLAAGEVWDEKLKIEDWDFMLRALIKDQVIFCFDTVGKYRVSDLNSIFRYKRDHLETLQEEKYILEKNYALLHGYLRWRLKYRLARVVQKIAFFEKNSERHYVGFTKFFRDTVALFNSIRTRRDGN